MTVKKDSLLVYLLKFLGILVGRCGSVSGMGERLVYEESRFEAWFYPRLGFSFLFIKTLSITDQKWQRPFTKGTTAAPSHSVKYCIR